jgi:hypothetical protein
MLHVGPSGDGQKNGGGGEVMIDLFNTNWWFLSQDLQVVCPFENARQQAMIAVLRQPVKFRV